MLPRVRSSRLRAGCGLPRTIRRRHVHDAVHHAPMTGERADVRILPRLVGRPELHGDCLSRIDQCAWRRVLADGRHELLRRAVRPRSSSHQQPTRSAASEPGAPSRKLCCMTSAFANTSSTSCPGPTVSSALVELQLMGNDAELQRRRPPALRGVGSATAQSALRRFRRAAGPRLSGKLSWPRVQRRSVGLSFDAIPAMFQPAAAFARPPRCTFHQARPGIRPRARKLPDSDGDRVRARLQHAVGQREDHRRAPPAGARPAARNRLSVDPDLERRCRRAQRQAPRRHLSPATARSV